MSTGRHINKICAAAIVLSLILTILFMNGSALGVVSAGKNLGYENRLFDTSTVHTVDIVMDGWEDFISTCENEEYSPCAVVIDGESYKNVGIRAKGNTSLSSVRSLGSERYSFKLEFDQYETGKTYHGLDKLSLNNLIQDNTMMKDYLVYQLMGEFGADAPLCSYVYITVNGEDWGLYLAVEGVEDSFLKRIYGSDSGELYKPDSLSFGGGRGNGREFTFGDFDFGDGKFPEPAGQALGGAEPAPAGEQTGEDFPFPGNGAVPEGFPGQPQGNREGGSRSGTAQESNGSTEAETNQALESAADEQTDGLREPPAGFGGDFGGGFGGFGGMGSADVKLQYIDDDSDSYSNIFDNAKTEITDADRQRLIASLKNLSSYTDLENTLDIDEVLRYFVVHNFVCNDDSYTGAMVHNYYLHEKDGKLSMIPWDYNLAFGTFQGGSADSSVNTSIDSPVSGGSVDDRPMVGWIFSDEKYTEQYHALFEEFLDRWFSDGQFALKIEETKNLISPYVESDPTKFCTAEEFETGVRTLEQFVTYRAEAVRIQLSGESSDVDTDGLTISAMGSMGGGKGGFGGGPGAGRGFGFAPGNFPQAAPSGIEPAKTSPGNASSQEEPSANDAVQEESASEAQTEDQTERQTESQAESQLEGQTETRREEETQMKGAGNTGAFPGAVLDDGFGGTLPDGEFAENVSAGQIPEGSPGSGLPQQGVPAANQLGESFTVSRQTESRTERQPDTQIGEQTEGQTEIQSEEEMQTKGTGSMGAFPDNAPDEAFTGAFPDSGSSGDVSLEELPAGFPEDGSP